MEKYKVKIYPKAQRDLKEIVDYLNTLSPQSALEYYDIIIERIESLSEMPKRCALVKDVSLRAKGYRFATVKNYIVFYCIKNNEVQIRRIIYNKRNYGNLLF